MRRLVVVTASVLALTACAGAASSGPTPSATVTTALPGFTDQWFKVDFAVQPQGAERRVTGYVYNGYGRSVDNVRMLAQALDASNQVVGQRLVWLLGGIPGNSRSYFEVGHLPAADHYRASLWSYSVSEGRF
jgi:hypothetical protein